MTRAGLSRSCDCMARIHSWYTLILLEKKKKKRIAIIQERFVKNFRAVKITSTGSFRSSIRPIQRENSSLKPVAASFCEKALISLREAAIFYVRRLLGKAHVWHSCCGTPFCSRIRGSWKMAFWSRWKTSIFKRESLPSHGTPFIGWRHQYASYWAYRSKHLSSNVAAPNGSPHRTFISAFYECPLLFPFGTRHSNYLYCR